MCCDMVPPGTVFFPIDPNGDTASLDTEVFGECGPCLAFLGMDLMAAEIDTQNPRPEASSEPPAIHCPSSKVARLPKPGRHQKAAPLNNPSQERGENDPPGSFIQEWEKDEVCPD